MHHHRRHAERVGHLAGMLAAGAAEADEGVAGDVVAPLDRDLLDGVGHVLDRDGEKAVGHSGGVASVPDLGGDRLEAPADHLDVDGLVLAGPEDLRKLRRQQLADHHVGVGHRQRTAAPVAGRSRVGAGGIRPDAEAGAIVVEDRPATRRDGVDLHHRGADPDARDLGLQRAFELARIVGDVGGRAPHVEADDLVESRDPGGLDRADDAPGRARQDGVLALKQVGRGQAAGRHHEHQADASGGGPGPATVGVLPGEGGGDPVDVAPQDRREVGVDHRGVAARHQLHQRRDGVARRHLGKAQRAGEVGHPALVVGKGVGVHEGDGHGVDAVGAGREQHRADRIQVGLGLDGAVGADPFVDLGDPLIEHVRLDDHLGEDVRARLMADLQGVAKALRDQEQRAVALALQQRVGGNRGAHLDAGDAARGDGGRGRQAHQVADAVQRRVLVGLGVFRQHLAGLKAAVRGPRHDVGERAASIDPEAPLARFHDVRSPFPPVRAPVDRRRPF